MDLNILDALTRLQQGQGQGVLVTIVTARGSTPRKAGAQMLVYPDGAIYGTIGGGCSEAQVKLRALDVLAAREAALYTVSLLDDLAAEEGMACGGVMEVLLQVII